MSHSHDHHHQEGVLSFNEKMIKLLDHWIDHNKDHAGSYTDWAEKATAEGLPEAAALLKTAADMTLSISETFEKAAKIIKDAS